MLKWLTTAARQLLDAIDPPAQPSVQPSVQPHYRTMPVEDRQAAALSLLDEEVLGFVLLQVRRTESRPEITLQGGSIPPEFETAVGMTLKNTAAYAYRVR